MRATPRLLAGMLCLVCLLPSIHTASIPLNIVKADDQDRLVMNQLGIIGLSHTENALRLMKHARKRLVSVTVTTANKFYNSSDPKSVAQYTYRFGLSLIQRVSWLAHPLAEFVKAPGLNRAGFECSWVVGCIRETEKEVFYDIPLVKSKSSQQAFVESSPFNFTTSENTKFDVRVPFFLVKDYPLSWRFPADGVLTLRKSVVLKQKTITPDIFNNQDFNMQLGKALKSEHANGPKWALDINRGSGKSFLHFEPTSQQISEIGKPGVPLTWFPMTVTQHTRLIFTSISNCTVPATPNSDCKTLPIRFTPILTIEDDANMFVGVDVFGFIGQTIEKLPSSPSCDLSDSSRMYCFFRDLKDLLTLPEIRFGFGGQEFPVDLKNLVNSCYLNHDAFYIEQKYSQYKFVCQMELKLRKNHESIGLPFFYRNLVVFDEGTSSVGVVAKSNLSVWNAFSVSELIDVDYIKQLKGKTSEQITKLFREKYKKHIKAGPKIASSPDQLPAEKN